MARKMKKDPVWISARRAAKILNVTSTTIINWCKDGVLSYSLLHKMYNVSYPEIMDIKNKVEIHEADKSFGDYIHEIRETRDSYRLQLDDYHKKIHALCHGNDNPDKSIKHIKWFVDSFSGVLLAIVENEVFDKLDILKPRDKDILLRLLDGYTVREVASEFEVSKERIRQILTRSARCLSEFVQVINHKNDKGYIECITLLKNKLDKTEYLLNHLRQKLSCYEPEGYDKEICVNEQFMDKLKTKVIDCNLSVRSLNALHSVDVMTIRDLVKQDRGHFLYYPNVGKKTVAELEDLLSSLGLHFGMTEEELQSHLLVAGNDNCNVEEKLTELLSVKLSSFFDNERDDEHQSLVRELYFRGLKRVCDVVKFKSVELFCSEINNKVFCCKVICFMADNDLYFGMDIPDNVKANLLADELIND